MRALLLFSSLLLAGCPNQQQRLDASLPDADGDAATDAGAAMDAGGATDAEPDGGEMDAATEDASTPASIPPRQGHTATLLADGRVLVTGGIGGFTETWRFDPATVMWTAGSTLGVERFNHTATRLPDGRVLIAGGARAPGVNGEILDSAALFDPITDTFAPTGSMLRPRSSHQALLLATGPDAGKVLIASGGAGLVRILELELYDPATGTFADTGAALPIQRDGASWTPLADGRILIAGGASRNGGFDILASALVYDPVSAELTPTAGDMSVARWNHAGELLGDGRVILIGGEDRNSSFIETEIFDPNTSTFSVGPALTTVRRGHAVVTVSDQRIFVIGGFSDMYLDTIEVFDPISEIFSLDPQTLSLPLSFLTATRLQEDRILTVGGQSTNGFIGGTFEIILP